MKEFMVGDALPEPDMKVNIDLWEVNETARVFLNGKEIGILWKAPYKVEVSGFLKSGENILTTIVFYLNRLDEMHPLKEIVLSLYYAQHGIR